MSHEFTALPVLKMPAALAIDAVKALHAHATPEERAAAIAALRPTTSKRTILYAYVLPSLAELRLFSGTLATGRLTRFGVAIACAEEAEATELMARQLVEVDRERVGFTDWLSGTNEPLPRADAITQFIDVSYELDANSKRQARDRLTKWTSYLLDFGVLRENGPATPRWLSVNARHLAALERSSQLPPASKQGPALVRAYEATSRAVGTRLYLPIERVRDNLGAEFQRDGLFLTDRQLDGMLRASTTLLKGTHSVSFSPFSGPAQGGLVVGDMYAGFISLHRRETQSEKVQR